jgi:hypothetical protein
LFVGHNSFIGFPLGDRKLSAFDEGLRVCRGQASILSTRLGKGVDGTDEYGGIVGETAAEGRKNATKCTRTLRTRSKTNGKQTRIQKNLLAD